MAVVVDEDLACEFGECVLTGSEFPVPRGGRVVEPTNTALDHLLVRGQQPVDLQAVQHRVEQRDDAGRDGESWSGQGDDLCPAGCFLALLAVLAAGTDTPATADLEVAEPDIAPAPEVAVRLLTERGSPTPTASGGRAGRCRTVHRRRR